MLGGRGAFSALHWRGRVPLSCAVLLCRFRTLQLQTSSAEAYAVHLHVSVQDRGVRACQQRSVGFPVTAFTPCGPVYLALCLASNLLRQLHCRPLPVYFSARGPAITTPRFWYSWSTTHSPATPRPSCTYVLRYVFLAACQSGLDCRMVPPAVLTFLGCRITK